MFYVYILQSQKDKSKYIGVTSDLKRRFRDHNSNNSTYSSSKSPFVLTWYCAFPDKMKDYAFEKYLKSSSGYAFTNKRFL
ncbi:MAG: GIY-YIG nuclease family protein [Candidatus Staskawiczbacteria bacterium]|nr:GIY-YIG nuclease family protein [Candidatus Staskawiczbacteria bacterium]